jgi:hypothetical protein
VERNGSTVFEETYQYYLSKIRKVDLFGLAGRLGARVEGEALKILLFQEEHSVSHEAILDASGRRAPHDVCVILANYVLLCPDTVPPPGGWSHFRDFRDAGPLTAYFANDVEGAVAKRFSKRRPALEKAGAHLGGEPPGISLSYDLSLTFCALPNIFLLLLFNDADEEFPAQSRLLFHSRTEALLDAECTAMLGRQLVERLRRVEKNSIFGT